MPQALPESRARLAVLLSGLLAAAVVAPGTASEIAAYRVAVDPALDNLDVEACFDGKPPAVLTTTWSGARGFLRKPRVEGTPASLTDRGLAWPSEAGGSCLRYTVDLREAPDGRRIRSIPGGLYLTPETWLWRPQGADSADNIEIRFLHQPGLEVAAAWPEMDSPRGQTRYRAPAEPEYWHARMMIGHFNRFEIRQQERAFRVAVAGEAFSPRQVRHWLAPYARALASISGRLPHRQASVFVVPTERVGSDPVPWGRTLRGGGPAIHLFPSRAAAPESIRRGWTAPHELSHLLLPFVDRDDAWLSEGLASYYQNILRARAGVMSEKEAWQAMHEGLERGRAGLDGRTLARASRHPRGRSDFRRIYWSGAVMMLLADWRLRTGSDGQWSLDRALAELQTCCLQTGRSWPARWLVRRLDRITDTSVFSDLRDHYLDSREFPSPTAAFNALGIRVNDGTVELDPSAPHAGIRSAIMGAGERKTVAAQDNPGQ